MGYASQGGFVWLVSCTSDLKSEGVVAELLNVDQVENFNNLGSYGEEKGG